MKNNLRNEVIKKTSLFWKALFDLLDKEKEKPIHDDECREEHLDDIYSIKMNRSTIWILKKDRNAAKAYCIQARKQKDDFPYVKMLDWFIKNTVLK